MIYFWYEYNVLKHISIVPLANICREHIQCPLLTIMRVTTVLYQCIVSVYPDTVSGICSNRTLNRGSMLIRITSISCVHTFLRTEIVTVKRSYINMTLNSIDVKLIILLYKFLVISTPIISAYFLISTRQIIQVDGICNVSR